MEIKFKKLVPEAVAPTKAHETDAGFDITAVSCNYDEFGNVVYGTGIAVEIPTNFVGLIFPRSSNAKKDLILSNSVGVIDSGYRGEILFKFKRLRGNHQNSYSYLNEAKYMIGDRIGQLIIMPLPEVYFVETEELSDSDRGTGGYGSTGK